MVRNFYRVAFWSSAIFLVTAQCAQAQITLHLTTTQQKSCVATTDANGLTAASGATDMTATGVSLTGDGCGINDSNFLATLSVPSTDVAGTPVNVVWSAGTAATQCFYVGTAGLTGWPIGSSACQGAACSTSHTVSITPTAAGNYTVGVVCSNASGVAQKSLTASSPPQAPQPANFPLTGIPATLTLGTSVTASWSVTGATTCVGAAKLGTTAVTLPGWNDASLTSVTPPRTFTPTQTGTYTLSMTCSNAAGSTASATSTMVVNPVATACSGAPQGLTRLVSSSMTYTPGGTGTRTGVDMTNYDEIWGHVTAHDTTVTFPGRPTSSPTIMSFGRNNYVAAKFHVPENLASTAYGWISPTDYNGGASITAAISTTCGDFNPASAACISVPTYGAVPYPKWDTATTGNKCHLQPGADYYLNLKFYNPTQDTATCPATASACSVGTANNVGGM